MSISKFSFGQKKRFEIENEKPVEIEGRIVIITIFQKFLKCQAARICILIISIKNQAQAAFITSGQAALKN